jgi:amino acid adenylation domain-containing protein
MGMLLQEPGAKEAVAKLDTVLLGGEALTPALSAQLTGPRRIVNVYGPTETTVWSTSQVVEPNGPITVGRPLANQTIYVLDKFGEPTPVGVPGELFIGGAGVVRGYHNRPELTAERFVPNPFAKKPGERMYRTGDLAKYRADGKIDLLGRADYQVKLRGFRIELGEIETALRKVAGIREAVVIVHEISPADKRLAAYLVADQSVDAAQLKAALKERLPDYMVPSLYTFLRTMPLTPNGKIDRRALPEPDGLRAVTVTPVVEPPSIVEAGATIDDAERHKILVEWNRTELPYRREACIHELFEAQVERTPDAVAAIYGRQEITYRELNKRANQLAHYLRSLGAGPEVLVGLCVERSFALLVGALGVFKAGAAYVPLDWTYPPERVRFMLNDTKAPLVVTQTSLLQHLPASAARLVCLDSDWERIAEHETANPPKIGGSSDTAYVMYTSGSTGVSKGVALEHRNAVSFIHWAREVFSDEELAGVLASTSICFDLSIFEMFVPLSWGGAVVLADSAVNLPSLPPNRSITLINTVPSAIKDLLKKAAIPSTVSVVNLAGEKLRTEVVNQLYALPHVRKVYDLYGPSEATTYATWTLRKANAPATVGRPVANTQIYILDAEMQPCPVGVAGEIYIGGDCLARGYINRPELTAERFIPDPFRPGGRLYKTGDLGRYFPDGNIDFLGRKDHQVKIRGYRIELGEIEAVLAEHPAVQECVAVARDAGAEEKQLTAYIVPQPSSKPSASDVRRFLRERLPDYMVPTAFVALSALPLTANGKVDRKALPAPTSATLLAEEGQLASAVTPVQEALIEIWRQVLGVEQVGLHDDFFDLGGHSVLVTQITLRVRQVLEIDLTMRHLFGAPTVAALAKVVEELLDEQLKQLSQDELTQLAAGTAKEVA